MSDPVTPEEHSRAKRTMKACKPGEYLVSTACPWCGIRFAMLGRQVMRTQTETGSLSGTQLKFPAREVWELRCANCGHECDGALKDGDS